jgi:hypothetical protein
MHAVQTLAEDEKAKMRRAIEAQRNFQRQSHNIVWRNPVNSKSAEELKAEFKGEGDAALCSFFMKTGACRYGEACSKPHPYPSISATIMVKNMYDGPGMTDIQDEDNDDGLELEEHEIYKSFREFFEDVVPEFQAFGNVLALRVCRNHSDHLRGHTYVMYSSEAEAKKAYDVLNGRFYAGKQLMIFFSPLVNWKGACCGSFAKGLCERGKNCNFLHVFKNPGGVLEGNMSEEAKTFSGLGFSGRNERGNERHNRNDRPSTSFVKGSDTIPGNADHKEIDRNRDSRDRKDDDRGRREDVRDRRDGVRDRRDEDRDRRDERRRDDDRDRRDERRDDGRRDDRDRYRDYDRDRYRDEDRDRRRDDDYDKRRDDRDDKRRDERDDNASEKRSFRDEKVEPKSKDDWRKRKGSDLQDESVTKKKSFRESF